MSYQVLARRWRPLTFEAVVGQAPIVRTLRNALAQSRIAHAYLFAGPRGVGKTTTARLLAMGLNCEGAPTGGAGPCAQCDPCREVASGRALDVIEIDGASNRGIDEVRALRDNARYAPARGRRKVYIIDEVHMLTEPAFNALLKILEEPPPHVAFVLATTEARRLPPTILSRCQRFDFRPIAGAEIGEALRRILDEEKVPADAVSPDALRLLARAADGSLRDALSLLDTALAYGEGRVSARTVEELLGSGGAEAAWGLASALVRRAAPDALQRIAEAAAAGLDLALLCEETLELLRRALLVTVTGSPGPDTTLDETARLTALGTEAGAGEADLLLLLRGLLDAENEMRRSPHPRVDLEITAVRLCHRPRAEAIETVLERLERAEARLRGYGGGVEPAGPVQPDLLGAPAAAVLSKPVAVPRPVERIATPAPRSGLAREAASADRDPSAPPPAAGAPHPAERHGRLARDRRRGHASPPDARAPPGRGGGRGGGGRAAHRRRAEREQVRAGPAQGRREPGARERDSPATLPRAPGRAAHHRRGAGGPGGAGAPTGPVGHRPVRRRGHPGSGRPWSARGHPPGVRARRGGAMKGFGNLVKEAQKLQAQLEALKEEVGKKKVEASAGGGMVVVEANGNQELLAIRIDREVITPDDPQMLEDLVLAAANEALRKARELVASEMSRVAGGLGAKLPGLM